MNTIVLVICALALLLLIYSVATVIHERVINGESMLQILSLIAVIAITITV